MTIQSKTVKYTLVEKWLYLVSSDVQLLITESGHKINESSRSLLVSWFL